MIEIRKCSINDLIKVNKLAIEIWNECYKEMLSDEQRKYMLDKFLSVEELTSQMNNYIEYYYILVDNQISGFFAYKKHEDHTYLHKLYAYKEQRGKGIMKCVLTYLEQFNNTIRLNTCRRNPTLSVYLKSGFKIIDEYDVNIGNDYLMDDYLLERIV